MGEQRTIEQQLLRRVLALRGDLERIALGYTDDPAWIRRECKEALDNDEAIHRQMYPGGACAS